MYQAWASLGSWIDHGLEFGVGSSEQAQTLKDDPAAEMGMRIRRIPCEHSIEQVKCLLFRFVTRDFGPWITTVHQCDRQVDRGGNPLRGARCGPLGKLQRLPRS